MLDDSTGSRAFAHATLGGFRHAFFWMPPRLESTRAVGCGRWTGRYTVEPQFAVRCLSATIDRNREPCVRPCVGLLSCGNFRCGQCWCTCNVAKVDAIEVEGTVVAALPNAMFRVSVDVSGEKHSILATVSGKMRKYYIRILPGDTVLLELSPYDLKRGRIIYRR